MKKHVVNQARKALLSLYTKITNLDMFIECQLNLLDNLVVPIFGFWGLVRYRKGSHINNLTNSESKTKHTICNAILWLRLCTIINKY